MHSTWSEAADEDKWSWASLIRNLSYRMKFWVWPWMLSRLYSILPFLLLWSFVVRCSRDLFSAYFNSNRNKHFCVILPYEMLRCDCTVSACAQKLSDVQLLACSWNKIKKTKLMWIWYTMQLVFVCPAEFSGLIVDCAVSTICFPDGNICGLLQ